MTWDIKKATIKGDAATIVLSHMAVEAVKAVDEVINEETGEVVIEAVEAVDEVEEIQTLHHYRTSFGGRLQTPDEWWANIRGEVRGHLTSLNASEPIEEDATALIKRVR